MNTGLRCVGSWVFTGIYAWLVVLFLAGCETPRQAARPMRPPPVAPKATPPPAPSPTSEPTIATNRLLPMFVREWERTGRQPTAQNQVVQTYRIKLEYPEFLGAGSLGLNQVIKGFVEGTKADFIASASNLDETTLASPTLPWSLTMHFSVAFFSPKFTSLFFEMETAAGGPHNRTDFYAINYDLEHQRELAITNILVSPEAFTQLSLRVVKRLAEHLDANTDAASIARGASPNPDNYLSFTVTPIRLVIHFPPEQVNAYAGGAKHLEFAMAEIGNLLAPDFLTLLRTAPPLTKP
jgi:hypothetical protein